MNRSFMNESKFSKNGIPDDIIAKNHLNYSIRLLFISEAFVELISASGQFRQWSRYGEKSSFGSCNNLKPRFFVVGAF